MFHVPHKSKTAKRKEQFNQVTALLQAAKIPYEDLLIKREISKQSDKTRKERLETLNPFSLKKCFKGARKMS